MRVLKFIVDSRGLRKDPKHELSSFTRDASSKMRAEFEFSPEWNNARVRVAGFWSNGVEYPPQVLDNGVTCIIPEEVLEKPSFEIQIFCKNKTSTMKTNKLQVRLNGGGL